MTYGLLGSIVLVYAVQLAVGWDDNPFTDVRLGANFAPLVMEGQWDRLITANFMHGRGMLNLHILVNGIALYSLGSAIEALLGRARFFIIYSIGCVGGAVASTLANHAVPSLGASTGIVGLFAAIGWVLWRFRSELPSYMRGATRQWVVLLVLNVVLWVALSSLPIDHWGHAGGFVAGGLATIACTIGWPPFVRSKVRELVAGGVALSFLIVFGWALATSAARFIGSTRDDRSTDARMMRAAIANPDAEPTELNYYAWYVALDTRADVSLTELARDAAALGIERLPGDATASDRGMIVDTLATLHFRLGDLDDAIRLEREALRLEPRPDYMMQLARFLDARVARDGPLIDRDAPDVRIAYEAESKSGVPEHVVTVRGETPHGLEVYALAHRSDELVGLVRYAVGAGHGASGRHRASEPWPERTSIAVALVDAQPDPPPEGARRIVTTGMDAVVLGYPGVLAPGNVR